MILYHHTCIEHLPFIMVDGYLRRREDLTRDWDTIAAVGPVSVDLGITWLTDIAQPGDGSAFGLGGPDLDAKAKASGFTGLADKTAVTFRLKLPRERLKHFPSYAKKRMPPHLYAIYKEPPHKPSRWWMSKRPISLADHCAEVTIRPFDFVGTLDETYALLEERGVIAREGA